jgi:alpha-N-arabinofuranosidase
MEILMKNKIAALIILFSGLILARNQDVFTNPILAGFYPDPSICKAGDSYYLVNSTFSYYPGITVFKSNDLVSWELAGYVMNRPEQMNLDSLGVSRGIFAPAIRYHEGLFYITCTLVDAGGNFVVTAKDPAGPWSNPVWIPQINGIDPSFFFDDDGKAYVLYNSIPPDDKPLYDGHRTIRMYEFDLEEMKVTGEEKILVNGGTDISKKPVWIEGPHIFKKDGFYYLIAAEGGTGENHSEVVFRSKDILGPYQPYEKNPVLTQRHLDPERENPITCTGHADFVETGNGDWWAVFLGCRPYQPYKENYYNTGRETFLAPVKWIDGWPVINPGYEEVQYTYPVPVKDTVKKGYPYSGNFTVKDDFDGETLDINWMFLRNVREQWYNLSDKKGFVSVRLRSETCSGNMNPSFIGRRQQHQKCEASASLLFSPRNENEKAGLVIFQNENHYYLLAKTMLNNKPAAALYKSGTGESLELLASKELGIEEAETQLNLKIEADGKDYAFYYSVGKGQWQLLKDKVDGTFLSTRTAGGFVGSMFAMYATSSGAGSNNTALFDWFEYKGNDEVYRIK